MLKSNRNHLITFVFCAALTVALVGGCLPHQPPARQTSLLAERLRPKQVDPGPNGLFMDIIFLERPFGDTELNRELWQTADEEVLDLAKRRVLESRGLRVAVLGGQLPAVLKALFRVDELRETDSGSLLTQSDHAAQIQTSGDYEAWPGEATAPDGTPKFPFAVGSLRTVPSIRPDGSVSVTIYPEIQFGDARRTFVSAPEQRGLLDWTFKVGRQTKVFDDMNFSLSLRPGQYLMMSCLASDAESLGAHFFTRVKDGHTVQRVVMINAEASHQALAARGKL